MGKTAAIFALFVSIGVEIGASWIYYLLVGCIVVADACEAILKSISEENKG